MALYKIQRIFKNRPGYKLTIKTHLTLAEAQEHCRDKETSSSTCTSVKMIVYTQKKGQWFDTYVEDKGKGKRTLKLVKVYTRKR